MTTVNVNTDGVNSVTVNTESRNVVVQETQASVVEVVTEGPSGNTPSGMHVDDSGKVDKSIIYYDSSSDSFLANNTWTVETLVLGGNF
jgi:copper chaperone CopZ